MTISGVQPKNLLVDVQGSNEGAKPGGTSIERSVTIRNRGKIEASIDLWIMPSDARSAPVARWCTFSQPLPIRIAPGQSQDILLRFNVPQHAEPGFYNYDISVQSIQYPGEQIQRAQQLRVFPLEQEAELRNEPSFFLAPPTDSDHPYELNAASTLDVTITVENHSKRVDRFFLSCPELDPTWFTLDYPETETDIPGLMSRTNSLQLNPNESGEVTLKLHPPQYVAAGHYSSTIRLISSNRDDLILLGIFYLNILSDDRLAVDLQPSSRKIPNPESSFTLSIGNPGNIQRELIIRAQDEDKVFNYTVEPESIVLEPSATQEISVTPRVRKSWQRPWRGNGKTIQFQIVIENQMIHRDETLDEADYPAVPAPIAASLVWQKRPSWLRWFLISLLILLILTGAFVLARWLLRILVIEPSLEPSITEFIATEETYQVRGGNPIRLNWEIVNYQKVNQLEVTYLNRDTGSQELQFTLVPQEIRSESSDITVDASNLLSIEGGYGRLKGQCSQPQPYKLNPLVSLLLKLYRYNEDLSASPTMIQCRSIELSPASDINQSSLADADELDGLVEDERDALPALSAGTYDVVLNVRRGDAQQASAEEQSPIKEEVSAITITPADPPEIVYFYSKVPIYRQRSERSSAPTNELRDVSSQPQYPAAPVTLNWIVNSPLDIESIEISFIHIAPDGTINVRQTEPYLMGRNAIPIGLEEQCDDSQRRRLVCNSVPTDAEEPGEYVFTLSLIMRDERDLDAIVQDAEAIQIFPPSPVITAFRVNGQSAADYPQQVHQMNAARQSINIPVEWEVENREDVTVELLPTPGVIDGIDITRMMYSLSPTPGQTTLTLQVTNSVGEIDRQSVVINIADFVPAEANAAPPFVVPPPPGLLEPPPLFDPSDLPPIQIPPRPQ
ncbi:MAG: hypothetical protein WBA43_22525 [Elainellaceae cyanobacterium]